MAFILHTLLSQTVCFEFKSLQDANVRSDALFFRNCKKVLFEEIRSFLPAFARTMRWFTPKRLSGM